MDAWKRAARAACENTMRHPSMHFTTTFMIVIFCLSGVLRSQGNLTLEIAPQSPSSFDTFGGGLAGQNQIVDGAGFLLRTESLLLTLTSTPTPVIPPSAQTPARRLQLWVAPETTSPIPTPFGSVFLDFLGAVQPVLLLDSFGNPFHPVFGPGNPASLVIPFRAEFYDPTYAFPLPTLVFQAMAEDTPGNGLQLSGGVRVQIIDPDATTDPANAPLTFAPTITEVLPRTLTCIGNLRPLGPESGGNTVTIMGTNFPAQSDWVNFPPLILFGSEAATNVFVVSNEMILCTTPPTPSPTTPPATSACLVDVRIMNNPYLAPSAQLFTSPEQYLYQSPNPPMINLPGMGPGPFNVDNGRPEGLEPRFVQGSWFLNPGITLRMTSVADPSLTVDLGPPTVSALTGGMITFITPPFCTGPVEVQVINCDEQCSNVAIFTYNEEPPVVVSATPTFSTTGQLAPRTTPAVPATGAVLTILGSGFIAENSPLAGSTTVDPTTFHPVKVYVSLDEIGTALPADPTQAAGLNWSLQCTAGTGGATATSTSITCPTQNLDQTGPIRPNLGYHHLRVENPPCVSSTSAPIAHNLDKGILIQDDAPPALNDVFPLIGPTTGDVFITILGSNFFGVKSGTFTQDFTPFADPAGDITNLDPTVLEVPAVSFGGFFAPYVELVSETELRVLLPRLPGPLQQTATVPIVVHNPDSQIAAQSFTFTYVPPLVDHNTQLLNPGLETLDAALLTQIAEGAFLDASGTLVSMGSGPMPFGPGVTTAPALCFIKNPSPVTDLNHDPNAPAGATHDYCFLFNTRTPTGAPRLFNFKEVDLPAVITLSGTGVAPFIAPFDPTQTPGAQVPSAPTGDVRVIVKALGFSLDPVTGHIVVDENISDPLAPPPALVSGTNHPFVLGASRTMSIDALVQLGGDAFHDEGIAGDSADRWRVHVDRVPAPAGGGRGGRGGIDFPEGLTMIPAPNFGAGASQLAGGRGEEPALRPVLAGPGSAASGGAGALGNTPIALMVGAGGGAGHVEPGTGGTGGTSLGGNGGQAFGNATASFVAPPPAFPAPAQDRVIYGTNAADMALFHMGQAVTSGALGGGSGGGGGGGGIAIVVPAICMGGRGGNGGGSFVALCNSVLELGPAGVILAYGDHGYTGLDAFPVPGSVPIIPLCLGGEGGAGSGGTVLGLAIAECTFENPASPSCSGGGLSPYCTAPQIDTRGGPAGPAPSPGGLQGLAGGGGGDGRIRFAVNALSPYLDIPAPVIPGDVPFRQDLTEMFGFAADAQGNPAGGGLPHLPFFVPAPEGFDAAYNTGSAPPLNPAELNAFYSWPAP